MLSLNPAFHLRVEEWKVRGCPKQNSVDLRIEPWLEYFPEYREFLNELSLMNLGLINRENLKSLISELGKKGKIMEGFLAAMVWGYAADSRGPFRVRRILDQPNSSTSIIKAFHFLQEGKTVEAFKSLVNEGPKFLGTAFATKYLYFASPDKILPRPLILDSLICEGLELWGNFQIDSLNVNEKRYKEFLEYMQDNAKALDISSEQLEFILFSEVAKYKGNQNWANRAHIGRLHDHERIVWGVLMSAEVLLRRDDLYLSFEEPGGGQYKCFVLRQMGRDGSEVMSLNLLGTIQIKGHSFINFGWNTLYDRGVSGAVELLSKPLSMKPLSHKTELPKHGMALRHMASILVRDFEDTTSKVVPIVVDNSVYGVSINTGILGHFGVHKGIIEDLPEIYGKPKENWLWAFVKNGKPEKLIDTYHCLELLPEGAVRDITTQCAWDMVLGNSI